MSVTQLNHADIRRLCGLFAYEEGQQYFRDGRVTIKPEMLEAACLSRYSAEVEGTKIHIVHVNLKSGEGVEADCTCSDYHPGDLYCRHIAAALFRIRELLGDRRTSARDDEPTDKEAERLAAGMLKLFEARPAARAGTRIFFETRAALEVEFTLTTLPYGYRKQLFAIGMKLGPQRLYAVPRIREVLDAVERGETLSLAKHFTYDPSLHCFRNEDEAILRELIEIRRSEKMFRDTTAPGILYARQGGGEKLLPILPYAWENLLPKLAASPGVKIETARAIADRLTVTDEPLPLAFMVDESSREAAYVLRVKGLDKALVMADYGVVVDGSRLRKMPAEACGRLADMTELLDTNIGVRSQMSIPEAAIGPFMDKVVPGLLALGPVEVAESVAGRVVREPLKARLYLDRVRDRLLAALEFQYGDIVVNPSEAEGGRRGESRILVRDRDKERRILELLEKSYIARTESGFYMDDEEAEYDFMYHVVPELEKLLDVYATSAVKARILPGPIAPKVTVNVDERTDWLEVTFDFGAVPDREIRQIVEALEEKHKYYRLPGGALLPLETEAFQAIVRFMNAMGAHMGGSVSGRSIRVPASRALRLADPALTSDAVKLGRPLRELLDNLRHPDGMEHPVPEELSAVLRDYQRYGYQWMKTLAHYGFGGILADDMGLGKTVQSIAFLLSVLPDIRSERRPALIVCPASLVYNWLNELGRFAPGIHAVVIDGHMAERKKTITEAIDGADAVITSYPLLRKDASLYAQRSWHTLILDEAQTFKNYATQTARAVKSLQARHRFALTGTPVENRLEELWSIYDAVFPGLFPPRKQFNELPRAAVSRRIRPFLLRRLKTDVLTELPDKIETVQSSELLPEQKKLYIAHLAKLQQDTLKHLAEDRDGYRKHRIRILAGLTRLRQICCHPALFVEGYEGGSAKLEQLLEIVDDCRSAGKRMLVFSQFTGMLELIGRELGYRGVPFFYLDGGTPAAQRVALCDRFNGGEGDLFLISLKAGGTGLNLTGADTVILYDLWWNPAVEQQAADRAHRIGQTNVVQVLRLFAQGTVEDKMFELQRRKMHLIDEVLGQGREEQASLSEEEIREILMI